MASHHYQVAIVAAALMWGASSIKADECETQARAIAMLPGITMGHRNAAGAYEIRSAEFSEANLTCPSFPGQSSIFSAFSNTPSPAPTFYSQASALAALVTNTPASRSKRGRSRASARHERARYRHGKCSMPASDSNAASLVGRALASSSTPRAQSLNNGRECTMRKLFTPRCATPPSPLAILAFPLLASALHRERDRATRAQPSQCS